MKRILALVLTFVMTLSLAACGSGSAGSGSSVPAGPPSTPASSPDAAPAGEGTPNLNYTKPKYLNMGTASVGGGYYVAGLALCDVLINQLGITCTAQNTGGATENNTLIQSEEVDFALTQSSMAYACVNGQAPYETKLENVSAVMGSITKGVFQVVTLEGSGINSMADLKGKTVSLGSAGGGAVNVSDEVLNLLYGFTTADMNATYSSYTDAASNLQDGKVDAVVWQASIPSTGLDELVATKGSAVKFVSFTDEEVKKILDNFGYYSRYDLSADEYGTAEGATTINLNNLPVCRSDLEDGLVYDMTKALCEHFDEVKAAYPATSCWSLETCPDVPIDLHPGAVAYYKEIDLIK